MIEEEISLEDTNKKNVQEDSDSTSSKNVNPKKSGSGLTTLIVIIILLILVAIGYLGYKDFKDTSEAEKTAGQSTATPLSSALVDPNQSPARDPELSVLARKYLDWIIAEQRSGEDLVTSETYKNLDYLTQNLKDSVKANSDSWQMSALTMSSDPIARYTIDSNYAQVADPTGQVNCTLYSDTKSWNVVLFTIKENGQWKIDNIGTAG